MIVVAAIGTRYHCRTDVLDERCWSEGSGEAEISMEISLTDFVDFTIKSGPAKVTKVREVKGRDPYEPAVDFWRPLREGIVEMHRAGRVTKEGLDAIIDAQSHALKLRLYPAASDGYLRFLGKKPPTWFEPPRGLWTSGPLAVRVNPEVGLPSA